MLCVPPGATDINGSGGTCCPAFDTFAWCPAACDESLLAVLEKSGTLHLYNVNRADQAVPRHVTPIMTMAPLGTGPSNGPAAVKLLHLAFVTKAVVENKSEKNGHKGNSTVGPHWLLVARGSRLACVQVGSSDGS